MTSSAEIPKFLNCCLHTFIFLWLVSQNCSNTNFKLCYLEFVLAWRFNILVKTSLYFASNLRNQPWRCIRFGAKLAFMAGIFLKKYPWYKKICFQFHFFAIWSISASILSTTAWKALASGWSPSELAIFIKIDTRCFGASGKIQDTVFPLIVALSLKIPPP